MGKPTIRMIGSNILFDIAKRKSELFEIKEAILWHSPFALINNSKDLELINTGEEIVDYEIHSALKRSISFEKTEYLVIEFYGAVHYNLIKYKDCLLTKNRFFERTSLFKNNRGLEQINPKYDNEFNYSKFLDELIDLINKYYESSNIILVRSNLPKYIQSKTYIHELGNSYNNDYLTKLDDYFIDKTSCRVIDIGKFFFADRLGKYAHLGNNFFSDNYYDTLFSILEKMISDNTIYNVTDISFELKLTQYITCYNLILFHKLQKVFWNTSRWIDNVVLALGYDALNKFKKNLLELEKKKFHSLEDAICLLENENCPEFLSLLKVVDASIKGSIYEVTEWKQAYKYNISALEKIDSLIKEELSKRNIVINNNVFFSDYINFLIVYPYIKGVYSNESFVEELIPKVSVDLWGSCVTREIFNYGRMNEFHIANYICRDSILYAFGNPVQLQIDYDNLCLFDNNAWRRNVIRNTLQRKNVNILNKSDAEWLILDFYDLAKYLQYEYENEFFTIGGAWHNYGFWNKIKDRVKKIDIFDMNDDFIQKRMDRFINWCNKRYKNKIILCSCYWNINYIDVFNRLGKIGNYDKDIQKGYDAKNKLVKKWEDYFCCHTKCYYINISNKFFADELNPYNTMGVHYEEIYYHEMSRIIKNIILNNNQNTNFYWNEVSIQTKIDRAIRVKELEWGEYRHFCGENDTLLYEMVYICDEKIIARYRDIIEIIIRNGYDNLRDVIYKFDFEGYGAIEFLNILSDGLLNRRKSNKE